MIARLASGLLFVLVASTAAHAADLPYPTRPIKLVVGATAGSGPDVASRIVADALRDSLGWEVVVENRPGADAIIATRAVVSAAPDGYTLLQATNGQIAITPILHKDLPFDVERDLKPVAAIARWPLAMIVPASSPFQTVAELVTFATRHPGKLNFASASSNYRLALDMLQTLSGSQLRHIPYQGIPAAVQAVVASEADVAIVNAVAAAALIKAGKLRALAVNTEERQPMLPDVPTFAEAGIRGFDFGIWLGMYAPSAVPPAVLAQLHAAVTASLANGELRAKLAALGMTPIGGSAQDVRAMIEQDRKAYTARARQLREESGRPE